MLAEVDSAVAFLSKLMGNRCTDPNQVVQFRSVLTKILTSHYENHWHPGKPNKGSGYRCIRIVEHKMDPLVLRAGFECGLNTEQLTSYLPNEITMWVDPEEVSYRFGEEGSIGLLYSGTGSDGYSDDSSSGSDSEVYSEVSSPSMSPTQEILRYNCRNESVSPQHTYYNTARSSNFSNFGQYLPQMQFVAS
mgnify:FL=1